MTGFPILDLVLGLVFIFFILSIISSAIVEVVMTRKNLRSRILTDWLLNIFDKEMIQPDGSRIKLGRAIADHCLTTALSREGRATSFMDAKNFVSALLEKLTYKPDEPDGKVITSLEELLKAINESQAVDGSSLLSTELRRTIMMFGSEAQMLAPASTNNANTTPADARNSFEVFREKLEYWFNSSMDRISGRMKKKYARPLTFWVGLTVVVTMNVDTIQISKYLYDHKTEARAFADRAEISAKALEGSLDSNATHRIQVSMDSLKAAIPKDFPMGWDNRQMQKADQSSFSFYGLKLIGWLATVMAIMLGAPFWFDMINKISNIRGVGNKPESTTDPQKQVK